MSINQMSINKGVFNKWPYSQAIEYYAAENKEVNLCVWIKREFYAVTLHEKNQNSYRVT